MVFIFHICYSLKNSRSKDRLFFFCGCLVKVNLFSCFKVGKIQIFTIQTVSKSTNLLLSKTTILSYNYPPPVNKKYIANKNKNISVLKNFDLNASNLHNFLSVDRFIEKTILVQSRPQRIDYTMF